MKIIKTANYKKAQEQLSSACKTCGKNLTDRDKMIGDGLCFACRRGLQNQQNMRLWNKNIPVQPVQPNQQMGYSV